MGPRPESEFTGPEKRSERIREAKEVQRIEADAIRVAEIVSPYGCADLQRIERRVREILNVTR